MPMEIVIANNVTSGRPIKLDSEVLKKHVISLGNSGSGKTVLCKKIIEECALKGIPSIIVDTQGDLASLAISESEKFKGVKVKIYTPASSKGIPISINPLNLPKTDLDYEEFVSILNTISTSITKLCGYNLNSDRGKSAQSYFYELLRYLYKHKIQVNNFHELIEEIEKNAFKTFASKSEIKDVKKKLKHLTIGKNDLLFNFGERLNINSLLKNGQVSVIYLNSLDNFSEKDFFLSVLSNSLYNYMIENPSKYIQSIFFIDEISSFLPPVKVTLSKQILRLIFKQARKYGIGCIVSTQNPGDIDYKAFAQFSTWFIGRITTRQDIEKIKTAFKNKLKIFNDLPRLSPGEFIMFSPDVSEYVQKIQVQKLLTEHKTLSLNDINDLIPKKLRKQDVIHEVSPSVKYFEQNTKIDVNALIEKNKNKSWFSKKKEQTDKMSFELVPYYKTLLRFRKKSFFKTKLLDYVVFFNAIEPHITVFKNNNAKRTYYLGKFLNSNKKEIDIIKLLMDLDDKLTTLEIAQKLKLDSSVVLRLLKNLKEMKIVSSKKLGKSWLWYNLLKIDVLFDLKKLESKQNVFTEGKLDADPLKPLIQIYEIEKLAENLFDADILKHEIVYFPIYKIKYISESGERDIQISAVDGQVIDLPSE